MTKDQRLHRETDPRVRRTIALATITALFLVATGLGVVAVRVHQVHQAYRLDALRVERVRLETLIRQLEVQVATLRSPRRVEAQARQLGLMPPAADQIKMAREFVSGGSGLSAAGAARVEAQAR